METLAAPQPVPSLQDRFAGSLLGQCLGDAAGFVVEGAPPSACRDYVTRVLATGRIEDQGRAGFPFGQYSDDSQLARELLESYAERGRFEPADYAARIAAIFRDDRIVGRGRATEAAAHRLMGGTPWNDAGTPPPAAGNGSAMRAGPVGLLFFDDADALVRAAHDQGRITHRDPRCSAGAVSIAGAVALVVRDAAPEPEAFVTRLAHWAQPFDPVLAEALERLPAWAQLPPDEAVRHIAPVGQVDGYAYGEVLGISPFVTGSVLWSLYAFLRSPDDYWQAIADAIAVGGDVDTTAAMTGAVSGARLGTQALPDLIRYVNDRGTWTAEELTALAHRCAERKTHAE